MKVQSVNSVNFRVKKPVKSKSTNPLPKTEEDLKFKKGSGKIMRRAFVFSAFMLTGALLYFRKKF